MAPASTKALIVQKSATPNAEFVNDAVLKSQPIPALNENQILVKINAAAFNHRDLWIKKGKYPGIVPGSTFGADGAGVVVSTGTPGDPLLHKRVFLVPTRGWETNPDAPESVFSIIGGGGSAAPLGTFSEYAVVERNFVIPSPNHLDDEHISAWPVGGLTAWRATVVNAQVQKGQNVLITGIGGGVAIVAVQLCLAIGANVYVTSGHDEKINKALELGAKGGVNYRQKNWSVQLEALLRKHHGKGDGALLSAVIDSGGGDIVGSVGKVLKRGGRVVIYGMTANPQVTFTMREVLKNQKILGSTMGSHKDLIEATAFISKHKIVPVVSSVLDGLESAEEGFKIIEGGSQFGKVVIRIRHNESVKETRAKL